MKYPKRDDGVRLIVPKDPARELEKSSDDDEEEYDDIDTTGRPMVNPEN